MTCRLPCEPLVIAVTTRALFDLREAAGLDGKLAPGRALYANDRTPLRPGSVFTLVRKLLALDTGTQPRVEVVLVSGDGVGAALRVLHSLDHHGLQVVRAVFAGGTPCHRYAAALGARLFLSTDADDVRLALSHGMAAATVVEGAAGEAADGIVRIACDGDAVLFSDEAEQVYTRSGLNAFTDSERRMRHLPLAPGPFYPFLAQLHWLQTLYGRDGWPVRTALVTARGVAAHERALRTLRAWNLGVDDAVFLAGMDKGPALRAFGADIFFDDQQRNCDHAAAFVPCAHVPYGVKNRTVRAALRRVA